MFGGCGGRVDTITCGSDHFDIYRSRGSNTLEGFRENILLTTDKFYCSILKCDGTHHTNVAYIVPYVLSSHKQIANGMHQACMHTSLHPFMNRGKSREASIFIHSWISGYQDIPGFTDCQLRRQI